MSVVLRRVTVLVAIASSLLVWSSPVRAAENESFGITAQPEVVNGVQRSSFEIPLETGATYRDTVKVYNKTDQPIDLALYTADANGSGPSNVSVGFQDQHPKGVGSWISLSRTKLSLAPHGEADVSFDIDVKTSDPAPAIGAIVVQNTATGLSADLAERLSILVRTAPPNSPTTSQRVRPLLFRSPWVIVAIAGLLVVIVLVIVGWRRSRRTRDKVVAPGEVEGADHLQKMQKIPVASLPVIRRLGAESSDVDQPDDESRPFLDDDMLVEVDEPLFIDDDDDFEAGDLDLPPARSRKTAARKPAATAKKPAARKAPAKRKPAPKRKPAAAREKREARNPKYIPLEDL